MQVEDRCGTPTPVIKANFVNPNAPAVQHLLNHGDAHLMEDHYRFPGPLQYFSEEQTIDQRPLTLLWEAKK